MSIAKQNKYIAEQNKYIKRISKLACGQAIAVPGYATVKAYRCMQTLKRKFSISKIDPALTIKPCGNCSFKLIKSDIRVFV